MQIAYEARNGRRGFVGIAFDVDTGRDIRKSYSEYAVREDAISAIKAEMRAYNTKREKVAA